jgi:hypothetical protein
MIESIIALAVLLAGALGFIKFKSMDLTIKKLKGENARGNINEIEADSKKSVDSIPSDKLADLANSLYPGDGKRSDDN